MACFPEASSSRSRIDFRRRDQVIITCERCLVFLTLQVRMFLKSPSCLVCVRVEWVGEVGGVIEYAKPREGMEKRAEVDDGGVGVNIKMSRLDMPAR